MSQSKIISWNINGIKSWSETEGVFDFLKKQNIDIFCIQEVRSSVEKLEIEYNQICPEFPFQYYHFGERKGYSGTAIFSKIKPTNVSFGILNSENKNIDEEGRVITLEFEKFILVNVYTPCSGQDLNRLDYRVNIWDKNFKLHLQNLKNKNKNKEIIVCGDMNVCAVDIDMQNCQYYFENEEGVKEKTTKEREGFCNFLNLGLVDIYRKIYPDKVDYSWVGPPKLQLPSMRLDYFLISKEIEKLTKDIEIFSNQEGSDHLPVCLYLESGFLKEDYANNKNIESEKIFHPKKEINQNSLF